MGQLDQIIDPDNLMFLENNIVSRQNGHLCGENGKDIHSVLVGV